MKLNRYEAWHYHKIAEIEKPFNLWIKEKPQGKMLFFGEWEDNGIYDVPEADGHEEFKKWILNDRKKYEEAETSLLEG